MSALEGHGLNSDSVELPASMRPLFESSNNICTLDLDRTLLVDGPVADPLYLVEITSLFLIRDIVFARVLLILKSIFPINLVLTVL